MIRKLIIAVLRQHGNLLFRKLVAARHGPTHAHSATFCDLSRLVNSVLSGSVFGARAVGNGRESVTR